MMARGEVDAVLTGADRIAANGDTANKIGTYSLAVLAAHHGIPLYVVAPTSTVDLATPTGAEIPIEERAGDEVTARFAARNPAFDVTPAELIAAIVTEQGVHRSPYADVSGRGGGRVRAIVLAAGYATRLRPLTDSIAKQLLPIGGRPMMDWVCDKVEEVTGDVHVVTNARFAERLPSAGRAARERHHRARRRDDLERRPARRDRRHRVRARAGRAPTTTCS